METFRGNLIWGILEIFQVCNLLGIYGNELEMYKSVPYTNININILIDYRLTCMQINTHFKNKIKKLGGNLFQI